MALAVLRDEQMAAIEAAAAEKAAVELVLREREAQLRVLRARDEIASKSESAVATVTSRGFTPIPRTYCCSSTRKQAAL